MHSALFVGKQLFHITVSCSGNLETPRQRTINPAMVSLIVCPERIVAYRTPSESRNISTIHPVNGHLANTIKRGAGWLYRSVPANGGSRRPSSSKIFKRYRNFGASTYLLFSPTAPWRLVCLRPGNLSCQLQRLALPGACAQHPPRQ